MKIFVTGGTGFVGSHFIRQALAAGHEVVALRRTGSVTKIPLSIEPLWITGGMDEVAVRHFSEVNAVVHLAAHSANVPYDTLENCLRWNVIAPLRLIRTAIEAGVIRFIVAGSCFEYGRSGEKYEFIPPDAPLEPTQTYPASKAAASIAFMQLAMDFGLQLSIHRIFQVYGEGEAAYRLWPSLIKAADEGRDFDMTPAEQVRDFIPVEQVAASLLGALLMPVKTGEPLVENVGTGHPQSLKTFSEAIWRQRQATGKLIFGVKPYRVGEIMRYVPLI